MAFSPSSLLAISTNPKPRDRPVSRSVIMLTRSTCPNGSNICRNSSSEVLKLRFPTKMFFTNRPCIELSKCELDAADLAGRGHLPENRDRSWQQFKCGQSIAGLSNPLVKSAGSRTLRSSPSAYFTRRASGSNLAKRAAQHPIWGFSWCLGIFLARPVPARRPSTHPPSNILRAYNRSATAGSSDRAACHTSGSSNSGSMQCRAGRNFPLRQRSCRNYTAPETCRVPHFSVLPACDLP